MGTAVPEGTLAAIASRVGEWETALCRASSDEAFLHAWQQVDAELRALTCGPSELYESGEGRALYGRLAPFQRRYLQAAELAEAGRLLLGRGSGADGRFRDRLETGFARSTFDRIQEAAQLVDLGRCRQVVVVGCGPLPAAALFFDELTRHCDVTALDIDATAVDVARRVAEAHGSRRLGIVHADGGDYDYAGADAVYVVNQVTDKPRVLRRIADTAPLDARVLVRDPAGPGRLLAESVDGALPRPWRIEATGALDPSFISRHLLLARDRR